MSTPAGSSPISLEVGTKVFAKVRGYPHWPARIEEVLDVKSSRFKVFFYGTYESAVIKRSDLLPYNDKTKVKYGTQKRKGFSEAMADIETNPDIQTQEQLQSSAPVDASPSIERAVVTPDIDTIDKEANCASDSDEVDSSSKVTEVSAVDTTTSPVPQDQSDNKFTRSGRLVKRKRHVDGEECVLKPTPRRRVSNKCTTPDSTAVIPSAGADIESTSNSVQDASVDDGDTKKGEELPAVDEQTEVTDISATQLEYIDANVDKLRTLQTEKRLVTLDLHIKRSLSIDAPKMDQCLDHLSQLTDLSELTALMLKKQPQVVTTVCKLRRYVGPRDDSEDKLADWTVKAASIRAKADELFKTFASILGLSGYDERLFATEFDILVDQLRIATSGWSEFDFVAMVNDPVGQDENRCQPNGSPAEHRAVKTVKAASINKSNSLGVFSTI